MRSKDRLAPLIYTSVVTLVGVAAMLGIVYTIVSRSALESTIEFVRPAEPPPTKQMGRLAYAPPSDPLPSKPVPVTPELRRSVVETSISVGSWSTETRPKELSKRSLRSPSRLSPATKTRRSKKSVRRRYWSRPLKARLAEISPKATIRLRKKFAAAKAVWPPTQIAFVAIKDEKAVELHARSEGGAWQHIHRYPVLAASGSAGPKLRQGDRQVPEGVYRIVYLNPKSAYHVSLRVGYPNAFDRKMAKKEGRKKLGGDIMIHGKKSSAGCLAMGDPAVEELFVLAAEVGRSNIKVIIAPTDFRSKRRPVFKRTQPVWVPELYGEISTAMAEFKKPPPKPGLLSLLFGKPGKVEKPWETE
jgi:L,D-transpeptidase catalytic domain